MGLGPPASAPRGQFWFTRLGRSPIVPCDIAYSEARQLRGHHLDSRNPGPAEPFRCEASKAGVNAKALSTFMGHPNISITLDRCGHLMPGSEEEAAGLLESYLAAQRKRAESAARSGGGEPTGAQAGAQLAAES